MEHIEINKERPFTRGSDYDSFSIVRVWNAVVARLQYCTWVEIKNLDNGKTVYRMMKGIGKAETYFPNDAIELDEKTALDELGIRPCPKDANGFYSCRLSIKPAGLVGRIKAHVTHRDPAYRYPMQIAMISLLVGVLGFVSGVASLIVAIWLS